jgi:hypothetical protein
MENGRAIRQSTCLPDGLRQAELAERIAVTRRITRAGSVRRRNRPRHEPYHPDPPMRISEKNAATIAIRNAQPLSTAS